MKYHKRGYFKKLIENNRNSSRNLWRILTSVLKFDFTFSAKESETEIDIEKINEYFVSEPQKDSNDCVLSTQEQEVTNERIENYLNSDFTPNNYFDFREMSENDLKEALNGMHSKNSCGTDIITNKMLKLIGPLIIPHILALINLVIKTSKFADCWKTSKVFPL
jgi:hypothetical protein